MKRCDKCVFCISPVTVQVGMHHRAFLKCMSQKTIGGESAAIIYVVYDVHMSHVYIMCVYVSLCVYTILYHSYSIDVWWCLISPTYWASHPVLPVLRLLPASSARSAPRSAPPPATARRSARPAPGHRPALPDHRPPTARRGEVLWPPIQPDPTRDGTDGTGSCATWNMERHGKTLFQLSFWPIKADKDRSLTQTLEQKGMGMSLVIYISNMEWRCREERDSNHSLCSDSKSAEPYHVKKGHINLRLSRLSTSIYPLPKRRHQITSSPVIMSPVRSRRYAVSYPATVAIMCVAPILGWRPKETKGKPILALLEATRMSQAMARHIPAPTAGPLIAATTGKGRDRTARNRW